MAAIVSESRIEVLSTDVIPTKDGVRQCFGNRVLVLSPCGRQVKLDEHPCKRAIRQWRVIRRKGGASTETHYDEKNEAGEDRRTT